MFNLNDLAIEIGTQLNNISEYLEKSIAFVITDNYQEYESHVTLKNGYTEYLYTPGVVSVVSPIVPDSNVGIYVGTYALNIYGYMDERNSVEDIFNFYMANFSGVTQKIDNNTVGINIGAFNIVNVIDDIKDGYIERGNRFEAEIILEVSLSINAELINSNDASVYVDGVKIAFNNIQQRNVKSILNITNSEDSVSYLEKNDARLVIDAVTLNIPLIKAELKETIIDGVIYNIGLYEKRYDLIDGVWVLINERGEINIKQNELRYSFIDNNFIEKEDGSYVRANNGDSYIFIYSYKFKNDKYGADKINEIFAKGNSHLFNAVNKIRLKLPQYDKEEDYVINMFEVILNKQNEPVGFTVEFVLAYKRRYVSIDDEVLNVINMSFTNTATEFINVLDTKDEVGNNDNNTITKSVLDTSVKAWVLSISHDDNSIVSSRILNEIVSDLKYENYHTLKINLGSILNISKSYEVMIKEGSYTIGESGLINYNILLTERGE